MKPFFNHGWTQINTDGEKTLTRIARIFAKGGGVGWGACGRSPGAKSDSLYAKRVRLSDWIRLDPSVQFFNHGLRAAVANTDKHGWGKDFDANCANFREGVRGWMGCLPHGHRAQLAGGPPALRPRHGRSSGFVRFG